MGQFICKLPAAGDVFDSGRLLLAPGGVPIDANLSTAVILSAAKDLCWAARDPSLRSG